MIEKIIYKYNLKNKSILIGISGGIDSVVLAHLLHQYNIPFFIAHCNFQLRNMESNNDEIFVKELAKKFNIPIFVKKFNTKEYSKDKNISIQMAARKLRFEWLENIRKENHIDYIAIATNLDDNIETFFINLLRGTGYAGITGISELSNQIIRPLLSISRNQIEKYAKENKIQWREDSSNQLDIYIRNKIRHQLTPKLFEINFNYKQVFNENFQKFKQVEIFVNDKIEEEIKKIIHSKDNQDFISIKKLNSLQHKKIILYECLRKYNFNYTQCQNIILELNNRVGKICISSTHIINFDRDFLIIESINQNNFDNNIEIHETTAELYLHHKKYNFKKIKIDFFVLDKNNNVHQFDFEKLKFPLKIRTWQYGDYFFPLGLNKRKKISDFLIDLKIPRINKSKILVLISDDKIIAILGLRINHNYRITKKTKYIFKITF